jgi:hypothetical protein
MAHTIRLRRILVATTAVTLALFGISNTASAQTIANTGPNSVNRIDSHTTVNCTVTNRNQLEATSTNQQTASSGDANNTGNTGQGPWDGWAALDPAHAQAAGLDYQAWHGAVTDWMAHHASDAGWNASETNTETPQPGNWDAYNPLSWQAAGQSFGSWHDAATDYMDSQSGVWALTWPATATSSVVGHVAATTGSATNTNHASFAIRLKNAVPRNGAPACSPGTMPAVGGSGGGPGGADTPVDSSSSGAQHSSPASLTNYAGYGGGGGKTATGYSTAPGGYTSSARSSGTLGAPVNGTASQPPHGPVNQPGTPAPGGNTGATISNTGPGSNNIISNSTTNNSSISSTNTVVITATNQQAATSGAATSGGSTAAGTAGSGQAANLNSADLATAAG